MWPLVLIALISAALASAYEESLTLGSFGQGMLLAQFSFSQSIDFPLDNNGRVLGTFPKPIYEIFYEYKLQSLRLTMSKTRWMYDRWGEPEWAAAPLGVSLGVVLSKESAYGSADDTWNRVVNSMSGIFCASLNLLTHQKTHRLGSPFSPAMQSPDHLYMSGTLPKETVCTENLTPFLRLLPCDNRAGLAGLLNPTRVFDAEYSLLDLVVTMKCTDKCRLEVSQHVRLVFDRLKWTSSCDWSVSGVFGRAVSKSCAGTEPKITVTKGKLGKFVGYLTDVDDNNLTFTATDAIDYGGVIPEAKQLSPPSLLTSATLAGVGQVRAVMSIHSHNVGQSDVSVSQMIQLDWYAKPFLHTMKVLLDGRPLHSDRYAIEYTPSIARARPSAIIVKATIPKGSKLYIYFDLEKMLLKYTEYPFDPNRGLDINPVHTVFTDDNGATKSVFTNHLLLTVPLPDFTMPYNVITLTCTLIAFFFGSLFNLFTRRYCYGKPQNWVRSIFMSLAGKLGHAKSE